MLPLRDASATPLCCVLGQCSQASSSQAISLHPPLSDTRRPLRFNPPSRSHSSQTLPARSQRMRAVPSASAIASSASEPLPCTSQGPALNRLLSRTTSLPPQHRSIAGSSWSKPTCQDEQKHIAALPNILPPRSTPDSARRQPRTTPASAWKGRQSYTRRFRSSSDAQITTASHAAPMAHHDTLKGASSPAAAAASSSSASSASTSSHNISRRPKRTLASSRGGSSLFHMLVTMAATVVASLAFLTPSLASAHDTISKRHPSFGLSPRELSKRALPATYNDFVAPLRKRLGTDNISAENLVDLNLSPPATCSTLNITWDPTKGTAPFTLAVFAELWFPLAIVNIPASYADPDLSLWLYQIELPQFQAGPIEVGNTPTIYAAITDSSGRMANTSSFITVDNSDTSCARDSTPLEFDTWSTGGPVQCHSWQLGWNVSGPNFVGPLVGMILPERRPPILLSPPENLILDADGTGGMNWTVAIPAGTYITYAMIDGGTGGSGGIGGKNLVGSDQYSNTACVLENPIGLATPTSTVAKMTVTPDLSTAIVTTANGVVTTIHTVIHNAGAGSGGGFGTGSIVGIALGLGAAAGILIALVFLTIYKRREKRRETRWEMPGGSDYPKGMPVDRRFVAKGNKKRGAEGGPTKNGPGSGLTLNIGNALGGGSNTDTPGASFARGQSLRGSFRSLGSSVYDPRVDLDSPSSSPPTPARPIMGEALYSDGSLRSADSTQPGFFSNRSRTEGLAHDERDTLIVANPSTSSPVDPFHGKRGSIGSPRGGSSNLASAYRSVLGTPEASAEGTYEDVQLHDRRPSRRSNSTGRDMPYRSASSGADSASNLSTYTPSSRGAIPRPRRGHSSRDDGAPPLPAFPEAYRRSPAPSSVGAANSHSTTPGGTLRSGNVMIHSDAGMLMDDRLSDDEEGGDQGELLELPPQYASLPARAHSTAGRPGASGGRAGGAAAGRHDSGAQTLSAATGAHAGRASAARNRPRGPTGDQKENEEGATLPSPMTGASIQDPFQEQTTPRRTQRNTGAGRGGAVSDEETEEEDAQRAERGTLDRFVGDEDDDAFWLPRGAG